MIDEELELATLPIRIYELKRLIKANGPKREPIEVETIEKYIEMMENCVRKRVITTNYITTKI